MRRWIYAILFAAIISAFALGFLTGGGGRDSGSGLEQVERDFQAVIDAQRTANERIANLETGIERIADYSIKLEQRNRSLEEGFGRLWQINNRVAKSIAGISNYITAINQSGGDLEERIDSAQGFTSESRKLIEEFAGIVEKVPE